MSYPVRRIEYCKTVGRSRVENIAEILRSFGFVVISEEPESHGIDIWVYRHYRLVLVIEVLNWRRKAYMDLSRAKAIRQNLSNNSYRDVRKLLVLSFFENIRNQLNCFEGLDIDFLELGFQTQPYYLFYATKGLADDMRPNNLATKNLVKKKLEAYLKETSLV